MELFIQLSDDAYISIFEIFTIMTALCSRGRITEYPNYKIVSYVFVNHGKFQLRPRLRLKLQNTFPKCVIL